MADALSMPCRPLNIPRTSHEGFRRNNAVATIYMRPYDPLTVRRMISTTLALTLPILSPE